MSGGWGGGRGNSNNNNNNYYYYYRKGFNSPTLPISESIGSYSLPASLAMRGGEGGDYFTYLP